MADRLMLIMQLGALANEAALRGEDRAAASLHEAAQMLLDDKRAVDAAAELHDAEAKRRADQARRKREERDRKSHNVTGRHATERDTPQVSSDSFLTPKENTTHGARDEAPLGFIDTLGEFWPSVERFIMRRDSSTWAGWFRQMTKEIGPGSQYTAADLAQVCDDDEALQSPIGTPFGLRIFLQKVRQERVAPPAGDLPPRPRRAGGGESAGADVFAKIRALAQSSPEPRQGNSRFIPRSEVEKLGPVAVRAYEAIGGAARVLAAMQDQKSIGFLVHEFTDAYSAAQREVA